MRRKNRKIKPDESETSASEKGESSELNNTNDSENHDESVDNNSDAPEPETKKRKKVSFSSKKAAKEKKEKDEKENSDTDNVQHEVEAVVDEKMIRGVKHYLIRWKGYTEEFDTWESEGTVNCPELIKQFHANRRSSTNSKSKKQKETKN
ncbi:chromobox protein [Holotrichia oblita]|uniref:Chromobox protein n=1 Tax=Holotrichia oblita TaxID=644536 RepID=A0ACB9TXW4_HOLOL|nr:chromobox protein [Holotrichia oblita]